MTIATAFYGVNMDTVDAVYAGIDFNPDQENFFGKFYVGKLGDVTTATTQQLQITDNSGNYVQNYYGNFVYNFSGLAGGTISKADFYEFGKKTYEFIAPAENTFDAVTVKSLFDSKNINKLLQYVFKENDVINGSPESDVLTGLTGDDVIYGNGGKDLLKGANGNDSLVGGLGKDILIGGKGADTFEFTSLTESGLTTQSRDVIVDFATKQDKLDLSGLDANAWAKGNNAFTALTTGVFTAFAAHTQGQLQFDSTTHILYANTDGDSAAEFSVQLTAVNHLLITSIIL